MKSQLRHIWPLLTFVLIFAAGYVTHVLVASVGADKMVLATQVEPSLRETGKYEYTAPLLLCATYESTELNQSAYLQNNIQSIVDSAIKSGKATDVSVYLRGFKGKWVGINENDDYAPASLLKVPLMIAYFKEAEINPGILERVVSYDGSFDDNDAETFKVPALIKPGQYTIQQLIQAMIEDSDNNATRLLNNNIDPKALASVYTDLGLTLPPTGGTAVPVISAKQYSYFFRILYNATYLTPEYSDLALKYLTAVDFPAGLESTVPSDVKVANKFGERTVVTPSGQVIERDLHDCGLVYADKSPYLLCVMTKGKDFNDLTGVIQSIGKFVYTNGLEISQ
jgi:beta-lactamase class A